MFLRLIGAMPNRDSTLVTFFTLLLDQSAWSNLFKILSSINNHVA